MASMAGQRKVLELLLRWLASKTRISALTAYTIEDYIAGVTFGGTYDGEYSRSITISSCKILEQSMLTGVYSFIVNQRLPSCNPYPGPRSVIIMDNAKFHLSEKLKILFLPAIPTEMICTSCHILILGLEPFVHPLQAFDHPRS